MSLCICSQEALHLPPQIRQHWSAVTHHTYFHQSAIQTVTDTSVVAKWPTIQNVVRKRPSKLNSQLSKNPLLQQGCPKLHGLAVRLYLVYQEKHFYVHDPLHSGACSHFSPQDTLVRCPLVFLTLSRRPPPGRLRGLKARRRALGSCDRWDGLSQWSSHDRKALDRKYASGAYQSLLATVVGASMERALGTVSCLHRATYMWPLGLKAHSSTDHIYVYRQRQGVKTDADSPPLDVRTPTDRSLPEHRGVLSAWRAEDRVSETAFLPLRLKKLAANPCSPSYFYCSWSWVLILNLFFTDFQAVEGRLDIKKKNKMLEFTEVCSF